MYLFAKYSYFMVPCQRIKAGKEDFNCEKVLAYGNCSEVRKMRHRKRHELVMAVKVMYLSSNSEEENKLIFSDLNVVTQTNQCPFIVNCYGILFTGVCIAHRLVTLSIIGGILDLYGVNAHMFGSFITRFAGSISRACYRESRSFSKRF